MNELIQQLTERFNLDPKTAEGVVAFLKENADKVPGWLGLGEKLDDLKDKLPGGLGGMLG